MRAAFSQRPRGRACLAACLRECLGGCLPGCASNRARGEAPSKAGAKAGEISQVPEMPGPDRPLLLVTAKVIAHLG